MTSSVKLTYFFNKDPRQVTQLFTEKYFYSHLKICMICIKQFFSSALFLFALSNIHAENQEQDLFRMADSLFVAGQYQFAAIEYERAFFYSEDVSTRAVALIQKAGCQKASENFDLAEKTLMRINYFGLSDSLAYLARHQTALCAYLAGNFINSESQLLQMSASGGISDSQLIINSMPLYVLVLNEQNKWNEAKEKLKDWVRLSNWPQSKKDSLTECIVSIYAEKNHPKLKKQGTAKILSSIVPGTGQIYAGYFFEGIANASLQGASLLLTAYGIYSGYYITSVVVWFGLFQKFYSGAIIRTEYLVDKKNNEMTRKYNNRLKKEVLSWQIKG